MLNQPFYIFVGCIFLFFSSKNIQLEQISFTDANYFLFKSFKKHAPLPC